MALQVWLPLNKEGDFKNRGLANLVVTNKNASYVTEGKLGGCYKVQNSSIQFSSFSFMEMKHGNSFSFFNWVKGTTNGWLYACNAFEVRLRPDYISIHNGPSGSNYSARYSATFDTNTWYHLGFTWDGSEDILRLYLNGVQVAQDKKSTITSYTINSTFNISYDGPRYINDFRIYDHCLSPKEIKEISKGLILHYALDSLGHNNINLVKSITSGGQTTVNNNVVTTSGVNADTYFNIITTENILVGDTYILSCIGENIPDDGVLYKGFGFPLEYEGNTALPFYIQNGYNEITFSPNPRTTGNTSWGTDIFMDDNDRNNVWANKCVFKNFQVFKCDRIYDNSGYKNNATISNKCITLSADTPRYSKSMYIGDSSITTPNLNISPPYTISYWQKTPNNENFNTNYIMVKWGDMFIYRDHNNIYQYSLLSAGVLLRESDKNIWNHIVITDDGTTIKGYVNGIEKASRTHSTVIKNIQIGPGYTDFMASDFRVYVTALSYNDILELYNTSVFLDKNIIASYSFNDFIWGTYSNSNSYINYNNWRYTNMLEEEQYGISSKKWLRTLTKYEQQNCKCTLTDDGYRIYRDPNLVYQNGNTVNSVMWGGLVIRNNNNILNLQKNHTYIILADIKGKTTNAMSDIKWNNNVDWGGGGLYPYPTNVILINPVTSNFNSDTYQTFSYQFTISDDIYKVCTTAYLSFVQGNTYLSYKDFKIGFTYANTGALGSDIYINNIRMYDITDTANDNLSVNKQGILSIRNLIENDSIQVTKVGEVVSYDFNEI